MNEKSEWQFLIDYVKDDTTDFGLDSYLAAAKEKERAATTVPAAPEAPAEKTDIAVGGGFQRPRRPRVHYGVCAA